MENSGGVSRVQGIRRNPSFSREGFAKPLNIWSNDKEETKKMCLKEVKYIHIYGGKNSNRNFISQPIFKPSDWLF